MTTLSDEDREFIENLKSKLLSCEAMDTGVIPVCFAMTTKDMKRLLSIIGSLQKEIERLQVREGYVVVPREATEEMLDAAMNTDLTAILRDLRDDASYAEVYKAMIQAAEGK